MTTLHAFLVFWSHFTATHDCQVFVPDSAGNGNHVIYGGGCADGFSLARSLHAIVAWAGSSQGSIGF